MSEDQRIEHRQVIVTDGGERSGFPLGLIVGLLVVVLLIALIWYFGFGFGGAVPGNGVGGPSPLPPVNPY